MIDLVHTRLMRSLAAKGPAAAMGVALLAAAAAPAQAKDMGDYLSYSWGRLAIQPQFDLSEMYTDNLFLGSGVNRVSDLSTQISPGLKLQYGLDGQNQISLEGSHDEILLLENPDKNTRQDRGSMTVRYQLSRLTLEGEDSIAYLSGFVGSVYNQSRMLVNRRVWVDRYTLTYDWTAKTDVYVIGYHSDTDYQSGVRLYDQNELRGTLGTSYQYDERFRFLLEGFYGQTALNPNDPILPPAPYSVVYGGYVGVRGTFTPKLSGYLRVGFEQRDFSSRQTSAAQTPALDLNITYTIRPKTVVNLVYARSSSPSPQFNRQFQVVDGVGLLVNQALGTTGRWLIRGHIQYQLSAFDAGPEPGLNLARTDQYWQAGAALLYQPRPWLTCSLAYDFENYTFKFDDARVAATFGLPRYHANRVTLGVSIGY